MGTSRPSGPSGVFWASSTCRYVGAHEDRVTRKMAKKSRSKFQVVLTP